MAYPLHELTLSEGLYSTRMPRPRVSRGPRRVLDGSYWVAVCFQILSVVACLVEHAPLDTRCLYFVGGVFDVMRGGCYVASSRDILVSHCVLQ